MFATKKNLSYLPLFIIFCSGLLFGLGLAVSQMAKPEIVQSFLLFEDLGLLFVMGVAVLIVLPFYTLYPKISRRSFFGSPLEKYPSLPFRKTVIGAIIFGLGWGIAAVCPGAALASLGIGNYQIIFALIGMFLGSYCVALLQQ